MLTKAPKTKHEQLVAAAQSFWWAVWSRAQVDDDIVAEQYRLAKCVCEKFAEYANVIDAVRFSLTSENALSNWAMAISQAISHPKSHHPVLHRMRRDAKSLREQLAALETEPRFEINNALGIALEDRHHAGDPAASRVAGGARGNTGGASDVSHDPPRPAISPGCVHPLV